jgi:DNA-binding GntR family transcriptional regulator
MGSFTFKVPQRADKKKLQALIEAQLIYERINEARLFFVHVLAIIGALVWLCLCWPTLFSQHTRAFILALWSTCGLATLAVSLCQWVWRHRRTLRLAEYEATPREGAR